MTDIPLRHGHTLAGVGRLAAIAAHRGAYTGTHGGIPATDRYDIAFSAIAEALYAAVEPPSEFDLIRCGRDAIGDTVRTDLRHHGMSTATPGRWWPAFARYWGQGPTASPEARVVDHVALAQIWPALSPPHRRALAALAACGDPAIAAAALGRPVVTFRRTLATARRAFLRLWHEGEEPSRPWAREHHGTHVSYRAARRLAARRTAGPAPAPVHGRASTYGNHGCRCLECTAAYTAQTTARRRATGTRPRTVVTAADRQRILALHDAGMSSVRIAREIGWSRATVGVVVRTHTRGGQT